MFVVVCLFTEEEEYEWYTSIYMSDLYIIVYMPSTGKYLELFWNLEYQIIVIQFSIEPCY